MNRLPLETRVKIIGLLVEGNSLRATTRLCDVSINTVSKLLVDIGAAAMKFHDETVRNVRVRRLQCDEIWSFVGAKAKNTSPERSWKVGEILGLGLGLMPIQNFAFLTSLVAVMRDGLRISCKTALAASKGAYRSLLMATRLIWKPWKAHSAWNATMPSFKRFTVLRWNRSGNTAPPVASDAT